MSIAKILLVDDDPEDRAIIIEALQQIGAVNSISCANNGEVALKTLVEFAEKNIYPCLIVLDLNMPRMNGRETLQKLKSHSLLKDIAVVIYSTSINPVEKEVCLQLGARLYIATPVTYKESLDTAKLFLELCDVDNSQTAIYK